MRQRILALLLAACMALGLFLPQAAYAAEEPLPFTDVKQSDWFSSAVRYVYEKGMMSGTGSTTFSPDTPITRGMIVTILHRLDGSPASTPPRWLV